MSLLLPVMTTAVMCPPGEIPVERCAGPTEYRRYVLEDIYSVVNFPAETVQDIEFISRRGDTVDAAIELEGTFKPNTVVSLTYYWFEVEDGGPDSPNRVHFLTHVHAYLDGRGFLMTLGPRDVDGPMDIMETSENLSGQTFFCKLGYCGVKFMAIPGIKYDFINDTIDVGVGFPALISGDDLQSAETFDLTWNLFGDTFGTLFTRFLPTP